MSRKIIFVILVVMALFVQKSVFAQDTGYGRAQPFYDEAVALMRQGKLDEAKLKFEGIKERYKSSIPKNSNIDELILK